MTMTPEVQLELAPGGELDIPTTVETPSLVVDLGRVRRNLEDMAAFARSRQVSLVPHIKTHRTPQFGAMQIASGAAGLCIAKLSEAAVFAEAGLTDLVMAYPIVGDAKFERAKQLVRHGVSLRLTTDDQGAATALGASYHRDGLVADVTIKVDTGFERVGLKPDAALALAVSLKDTPGLRVRGFICHEGHAAGAASNSAVHELSVDTGVVMTSLLNHARSVGVDANVASVGSTATAKHTAAVDGVTEIRPGIYPFNDFGQVLRGTVGLESCAARVVTTVVSHTAADRAIIDAGSKSLGQDLLGIWFADASPGHGLLIGQPGWKLYKLSEEHGWLRWEGSGAPTPLAVGQRLQVLPNHICSVFHVLGESVVVEDGEAVGTWVATARGCSK